MDPENAKVDISYRAIYQQLQINLLILLDKLVIIYFWFATESDWELPDDLKNDPFFKEEMELRRKDQLKQDQAERDKKDQEFARLELEKQQREVNIDHVLIITSLLIET